MGGTFTDFTLLAEHDGSLHYFKVPSTPSDPSQAIKAGLVHLLAEHRIAGDELIHVGHGTTVATNMVIERRGSKTAILTTKGFRDVLEIGRQSRPHLYDYNVTKPEPLVQRQLRFEIRERLGHDGQVIEALDESQVEEAAAQIATHGVEAVSVCYMHSYRNAAHEQRTRDILKRMLPGVFISVSSEILPEFREFERMSTTALNAYVGPRMAAYMRNLVESVKAMGVAVSPSTVHSNGGLMSVGSVMMAPVRTCVSGPAAGVIGSVELGRVAGFPNMITFDVGGTSTDVSLIADLEPLFTSSRLVADYPVKTRMIDVHVIGAGGGSIARLDDAGALKVGPQSAGAVPGPVAYQRGGTVATLTDAHMALGRLNPVALLEGRMPVFHQQACDVIREQIATPLGISMEEAAYGIIRIANSNMARAVRSVSTERGHDVRHFALVSFGGAGGLHGAELARDCGIGSILVPQETPISMQGYFRDPVQTAAAFRDGWLMTGDLVRQDEDGFFFHLSRLKDIIRKRGENIAAAELEAVVGEHAAVQEVAALALPSELGEDEILIVAVLDPHVAQAPTHADVAGWCRDRLAPIKVPRYVAFIDAMPYTPTHKISKAALRADPQVRQRMVDLQAAA